jgi:hypothetical protein
MQKTSDARLAISVLTLRWLMVLTLRWLMGEVGTSIGMDARRNGCRNNWIGLIITIKVRNPFWVMSPLVILPEKSSLSAFFQSVNQLFL